MAKTKSAKSDGKKKSRPAPSRGTKPVSAAAKRGAKKTPAPRAPARTAGVPPRKPEPARAPDPKEKPKKGAVPKLPHGKPTVAEPRAKDRGGKVAKPASRRLANSELQRIRSMLSQKKLALTSHIQAELSELEKPEKRHRADLEEIASDTHDTDSLCEIMDIEASQIDQIDMAVAKIDNGTYGICEDCSGEIPLVRLEALPFATQCIDCKRKAEFEGQISRSDSSRPA